MNKADSILAQINAGLSARSTNLENTRRTRRTLPDLCNLFEAAWRKGQHDRDSTVLAARLVARDRALLKSQIIVPARDLDIDLEAFALFCTTHWDAIGAAYFKKAKSYPVAPAFPWLVRCLETYMRAYQARDLLDPTGKLKTTGGASHEAVAALKDAASERIADLEAQLRIEQESNTELREQHGLSVDDDPVYARIAKAAKKVIKIGKYEDDDTPSKPRRKLARHKK